MLSTVSLAALSLFATLSPQEADFYAGQLGRPMPAVVPLEEPVFQSIQFGPGDAPFVIFMNKDGGTYTCGDNDSRSNRSTIACGASPAQVGDWPGSDAEWSQFMACSVDLFSRFNVTVTDVEPASGDYVEAVIGGTPQQVGMGSGVGGVAPYQCGVIPRAVVYAFADVYFGGGNWWRDVCETAAQEVVHAFGLDHEFLCADPMTYLSGCGEKTFQDVNAQCGEFEPRACDCTGATQNSVQEMLDLFGPAGPPVDDPVPPTVSLVSPGNGAVLQANSEIQIVAQASDDLGIRSVVLEWDFNGNRMACPGSGDNFACVQSGTSYTWTINVGTGSRTFRVRATDVGLNDVVTGDRTISLGDAPSDPVGPVGPGEDDDVPPSVVVGSPSNGAVLPSNQTINVVATISDDIAVASATLFWEFNGETYPCPHSSEYVTCTKSGTQFTWSLAVGAGSRTFHVAAADGAGNTALTTSRTIELVDGAAPPVDDSREDDDSIDTAGAVRCGDAHALHATDADWFALDGAAGNDVTIQTGNAALELLATSNGVDQLANANGSITFTAPSSGRAFIAVLPANANGGSYTLTIACTPSTGDPSGPSDPSGPAEPSDPSNPSDPSAGETPIDAPRVTTSGGCAQTTPSGALMSLVALALLRRRRR
jgi:hypothetical protein